MNISRTRLALATKAKPKSAVRGTKAATGRSWNFPKCREASPAHTTEPTPAMQSATTLSPKLARPPDQDRFMIFRNLPDPATGAGRFRASPQPGHDLRRNGRSPAVHAGRSPAALFLNALNHLPRILRRKPDHGSPRPLNANFCMSSPLILTTPYNSIITHQLSTYSKWRIYPFQLDILIIGR